MKKSMKPGTMLNPLPVVLVSCADGTEDNLITIAWTGIINSNPPITYVSVRKSRKSHKMIENSGEFVINLVTEDMVRETDFCGVKSGRDVNKFQVCGLEREKADIVKAPMLAKSPLNLECVVKEVKEFPSHDMFIAEIVAVHGEEGLFDERGRFCLDRANLISYSHGEYFGLKRHPLGSFGYSIMKPKTRKRRNREKMKRR
ncbi:MAG: flavin reductase family protein [Peptostreptococcaceae bacterium]|nr:flavin reductase family protein [Peptostreptococcaceae bacterium]MDY5738707.1 flavin reductase family protein [Anaerovoracaceae bacterium]SFE43057.1 NADH-FMN oxidoreductase RutF, flavin reductase (DIM6/NTAB) family [Peptostreptococcaceae bacterium pGA-8]